MLLFRLHDHHDPLCELDLGLRGFKFIADAKGKTVGERDDLKLVFDAAQAYAGISGRDYVLPDDVKKIAVPVLSHRVISRSQSTLRLADSNEIIIGYIVDTVPAPIE